MKRFFFTDHFKKQHKKLPAHIQKKLARQLKLLADDIRHPSIRARKMAHTSDVWEGRVDYHWRFTFTVREETIILRSVGTHEIYRAA